MGNIEIALRFGQVLLLDSERARHLGRFVDSEFARTGSLLARELLRNIVLLKRAFVVFANLLEIPLIPAVVGINFL